MNLFSTVVDLGLVVLGFSLIIFLHELGHFAAARWANVRVLAFAMGFGPAVVSYRKGMGFRRGSSEGAYKAWLRERGISERSAGAGGAVSPTEYRLNALPLGGYVKMLGQDDSDPGATSDAPDSFNRAPVFKRMVIISAGVVMNLVTAAVLFVIVFAVGLKTETARLGAVLPGLPASVAKGFPVSGPQGEPLVGLRPGDVPLSVDGEPIESFKDLNLAVAMSAKGRPLSVVVRREGFDQPLAFTVTPRVEPATGLLAIGVMPAMTGVLSSEIPGDRIAEFQKAAAGLGKGGERLRPGMRLVDQGGLERDGVWLAARLRASGGEPQDLRFVDPAGGPEVVVTTRPRMEMQRASVKRQEGDAEVTTEHLAGLTPVLMVDATSEQGAKAGLLAGDVFVQLGSVSWPSVDQGLQEIRGRDVKTLRARVLRGGRVVDLGDLPVIEQRIGFAPAAATALPLVTRFPDGEITESGKPREGPFAATQAEVTPGSRVLAVGGREVDSFASMRSAMVELIGAGRLEIPLTLRLPPIKGEPPTVETKVLKLTEADARRLAGLGWELAEVPGLFEVESVVLQRSNPVEAIGKGIDETRKMILTTYLTFARLFQGTVKVEHLKGPIGIAHVGTILADRGLVWLLFFMAAVSINLAVVNFLPLPIVDGGHFCFLLWERITGKPVSVAVQNGAALVGLALIVTVFVITTYNDLANLLWR